MGRYISCRLCFFVTFGLVSTVFPSSRAADEASSGAAVDSAPSPGLLIAGIGLAAGGGVLGYYSAHQYAYGSYTGDGQQWALLGEVAALTMEGGGALATLWGWRLGEHDFRVDRATGGPIRDRSSLAI